MRIVQTFWTGGHNPLEYGFGWPHPEYNLMSWALSCLSLREHYDEVVLYTDSAGFHILIEILRLPYSEVHIIYDDTKWLPQHWAQAKIKTYSLQTKPFLHVDGDIYVPRPLPEDVLSAPLITQNREIGTRYYRQMMEKLLSYPEILIPHFVQKALSEESIASYNMGFFGGSDLGFIHYYCNEVFRFMEENRMNDPSARCSQLECNVFFEQIIFAVMTDNKNRMVTNIVDNPVKDNGYSDRDFCDILSYSLKNFFHILGGHKNQAKIYKALERVLLGRYPKYYLKIMSLFSNRHSRLVLNKLPESHLNVEMCIAQYEDILISQERKWKDLSFERLFHLEHSIANYHYFVEVDAQRLDDIIICKNPYIAYFKIPSSWVPMAVWILGERLHVDMSESYHEIAVRPTLYGKGIKDVAICDLAVNILTILDDGPCSYSQLQNLLKDCFHIRKTENYININELIFKQTEYLLFHGLIILQH